MVGNEILNDKGVPVVDGKKLSASAYNPPSEVIELFSKCQSAYQVAWRLQHRTFDEFDGLSLLDRAKRDQETFGAFVGAEFVPQHKRWRWRGRKNTARNKLIGILAHMLSAILFPTVYAQNPEDEQDKTTARVMRILIEEHLQRAGYKMKFLYMVLTALVNPAVIVEVDYLVAFQSIKERLANGEIKVTEAVDTILSGLSMNIVPIDQLLLGDFFVSSDIQKQPYIVRVNRLPYDTARKIYAKKYFVDGKDQFDFVEAGKTRIVMAGQEHATLYDVEWTEADSSAVQVLTFQFRGDDLEATFVGGVFMGEYTNVYNANPFKHRRMSLIGDEWKTIPIYNYAMSGFEPIDPTGRFAYFKSGAFKEYWEDSTQNRIHQMLIDATALDTIKPILGTGIMKVDSTVIAPGAYITTPNAGASLTPWSSNPNLRAAYEAMDLQKKDMSESTQDKIMSGVTEPNVTATQSIQALNQARIFLGVFGIMIADLIQQVGALSMDCIIQHTTMGEIDATIPEALGLKAKTFLAKTKERGMEVTNRIIFTDAFMGKKYTPQQVSDREWALHEKAGGSASDQIIFEVNPYRFARTLFSMSLDADEITQHAIGDDRRRKIEAIQMFTNPIISPYVDMKNVVDDFVIEEFGGNNPDRYRNKGSVDDIMKAVMMGQENAKKSQPPQQAGQEQLSIIR